MKDLINTKAFARFINGIQIEEGDADMPAPSRSAFTVHDSGFTGKVNATADTNNEWTYSIPVLYRKRQLAKSLKLLSMTPAKYMLMRANRSRFEGYEYNDVTMA